MGQQDFFCRRILIVPPRFAREAMARGRLSFEAFHATFIQPFLTEADFLVNNTAMTHWWMAATTDRAAHGAAAAANHSALEVDVSEDGNYAARAQLLA